MVAATKWIKTQRLMIQLTMTMSYLMYPTAHALEPITTYDKLPPTVNDDVWFIIINNSNQLRE